MPLANSNGPGWIRKQKASVDRSLTGVNPIRRFVAALFGRGGEAGRPKRSGAGSDEGNATAGMAACRPPRVPVLAGGAARRLEDEPG
jgi:hypothetical protein